MQNVHCRWQVKDGDGTNLVCGASMSTNYQVRFQCFLPTAGQDHNRTCFVETPFGGTPSLPLYKRVNTLILGGGTAFFQLADSDIMFGGTARSVGNSAGGWISIKEEGGRLLASGEITFLKFDSSGGTTNFMVNFSPTQDIVKLK